MKFTAEIFETPERYNEGISHRVNCTFRSKDNPELMVADAWLARGWDNDRADAIGHFWHAARAGLAACVNLALKKRAAHLKPCNKTDLELAQELGIDYGGEEF